MMRSIGFIFTLCCWMQLSYGFTLIIDPGHGGRFFGARGAYGRIVEKQATLDVAIRLAKLLSKHGVTSILTRIHDNALSPNLLNDLEQRATKAEGCDAFISLHFDSSPVPTTQCFQLYVPFSEPLSIQSYALAVYIHTSLAHSIEPVWVGSLGNLNKVDGGIRQARFNVLIKAKCPAAVLIELGYLSHARTETKVAEPLYRQQLAEAVGKGILDYVKTLKDGGGPQEKLGKIKMLT